MRLLTKAVFLFVLVISFSVGHSAELTQERWINFMTKNLPSLFCKPDQYYRECYEVGNAECLDTVSFAVESCIISYVHELPDIFTYTDSRHWGAIIEKCVDEEYTRTYSNQKLDTEECKEF